MNNTRRKKINKIIEKIEFLYDEIEAVKNEEEDYRDNIPENLICSEKYDKAEDIINNLEEANGYVEDIKNLLTDIMQ